MGNEKKYHSMGPVSYTHLIVDPATSEKTQGYIDKLVELRQKKGMTPDQAKEILLNQYLYYGCLLYTSRCV